MLAGRDQIIDNNAMRDYFQKLSATQKELIEYPRAAHTLEFEPDPTPFFNDLANWILRTAANDARSC